MDIKHTYMSILVFLIVFKVIMVSTLGYLLFSKYNSK